MTQTSSHKTILKYLDNLLNELPATDGTTPTNDVIHHHCPIDTIDTTHRMVPTIDIFELMSLESPQLEQLELQINLRRWLSVHFLLPITMQLPCSGIKNYLIQQCQTLLCRIST